MPWQVLQTRDRRRRDKPPLRVTWKIAKQTPSRYSSGGNRYTGNLTSTATDILMEAGRELGYKRVGLTILEGTDEDKGKFALVPADYPGHINPTVVTLSSGTSTGRATVFAAGALARVQPDGQSLLEVRVHERFGTILVGSFGDAYQPTKGKNKKGIHTK